jgi:putative membrane protein insertion efficiency factor
MKVYKILTSIIILVVSTTVRAQDSFAPHGAKIAVADDLFSDKIKFTHNHSNEKANNVISAPQGGAFFMIRFFQIIISPQDGPSCKYHPTCSSYGRDAIKIHGALIGSFMAGDRILRCNQYTHGRYDPVPKNILSK